MSKKIGIPGWVGSGMFGVTQPYAEFISQYGELCIITPNEGIREDLDMLVLPGGADISPAGYSADTLISYYNGNSNPLLEHFDKHKLDHYLNMGLGMLTICRASQNIWRKFGGEIVQHNFWHKQSEHNKHECHELVWNGERTKQQYSKYIEKVNSRHHQTMSSENYIPEGLQVLAWAKHDSYPKESIPDKSIVEIFASDNGQIFGYQGHPEDMLNDSLTPMIMESLLNYKTEKETSKVI